MFDCGLQNIFQLKSGQSRSINWENRNGEKGKGDFTIASWVKFYPHPGFYDYDASWELSN